MNITDDLFSSTRTDEATPVIHPISSYFNGGFSNSRKLDKLYINQVVFLSKSFKVLKKLNRL